MFPPVFYLLSSNPIHLDSCEHITKIKRIWLQQNYATPSKYTLHGVWNVCLCHPFSNTKLSSIHIGLQNDMPNVMNRLGPFFARRYFWLPGFDQLLVAPGRNRWPSANIRPCHHWRPAANTAIQVTAAHPIVPALWHRDLLLSGGRHSPELSHSGSLHYCLSQVSSLGVTWSSTSKVPSLPCTRCLSWWPRLPLPLPSIRA